MQNIPRGSLLELIQDNTKSTHPMHMPGHKRNADILPNALPWSIDVTEVAPFDNLQNSNGILAEGEKIAAELYSSAQSFFLINGSTCGILAGIRAATKRGDKILVSRNCHMSVWHAIELCGLNPVFIDPPIASPYNFYGSVPPCSVEKALSEHSGISLVVLVSPTYEGVLSDISSISALLHSHNIPLLVDEAHGAHLGFRESEFFPKSAVRSGADIVVHSLHKTLPSLTQTGLLHVNSSLVSAESVARELRIFQSSSPSYPLMASIDYCCRTLVAHGAEMQLLHEEYLREFYAKAKNLKNLKIIIPNEFSFDPAKIIIYTGNTAYIGKTLTEKLADKYGIILEMSAGNYALAMTSLCDKKEDIELLYSALFSIDSTCNPAQSAISPALLEFGTQIITPEAAVAAPSEKVSTAHCAGRISAEYVWHYPPGAPLLIPGQEISPPLARYLAEEHSEALHSTSGALPDMISVLRHSENASELDCR